MKTKIFYYLGIWIRGVAMGIADLIPWVSWWTIALIVWIYDKFINSIKSINLEFVKILFTNWPKKAREYINWSFLISLVLGIFFSILLFSNLISYLLTEQTKLIFWFFFGLIFASVIYMIYWTKDSIKRNIEYVLIFIFWTIVWFLITQFTQSQTPETWRFIMLSWAIAICAMILPGISGSFILLILWKYEFVLNAVKSYDMYIIFLFGMWCVLWLMIFSRFISWLFARYYNISLVFLIWFVLGSLNKIRPRKQIISTYTNTKWEILPLVEKNISPFFYEKITSDNNQLLYVILMFLVWFLIIFTIEFISKKIKASNNLDK